MIIKIKLEKKEESFIGKTFSDPNFVSTTLDESIIDDFVEDIGEGKKETILFEILVPKGTNGAYVEFKELSKRNQQEFLLPRNSKFKITGLRMVEASDLPVFEAELLP